MRISRFVPPLALAILVVWPVGAQTTPLTFPLRKGDVEFATLEMQRGSHSTGITLRLTSTRHSELTTFATLHKDESFRFSVGSRVLPLSPAKRPIAPGTIFCLLDLDDAVAVAKELLY